MSLKKLTDINNNDIQVESAIKDAKGQSIHSTYQEKLTTTSVSDGTINKVIGFDTNGDIVKGAQSGGGMTNPMTTSQDLIVGGNSGTPTRLGKGSNGELLGVNGSGNLAYTKSLPILTTAPSSANTNGLIIVVLSSEPATKYSGYLYLITE